MKLSLAFSPCPNDCFMFDAMVHGRVDCEGLEFVVSLADIEALNHAAFAGAPDITKLSFHAYAYCADKYVLLDAGSALGRNCGPLLISRRSIERAEVERGQLSIAIPGKYTTANFLCGLAFPAARNRTEVLFSDIEPALLGGRFDAGVIIHENRFTYEAKGLRKIIDLGEFWEAETGAPIPLGGIVVRRSLPDDVKRAVNRVMRRSVEYAFANRAASLPYVRAHAQEMSEQVMYQHIDLYVNDYSVDLGEQGRRAVEVLFDRAQRAGIVPRVERDLFLDEKTVTWPDRAHEVRRSQRKERMLLAAHVLTGFLLITKGLHKLVEGHASPALLALTLGGGALSLAAAMFHRRLHDAKHGVGALISFVESAACLLVALSYVESGTRYLQYPLFLASAIALGAAVVQLTRRRASGSRVVTPAISE
jgi:1,4-dihydroxy-6-naphthoate synthase